MNKYKYTAKDRNGRQIKGTFVAENEAKMKEMLLKAGYYVTSFRQLSSGPTSAFFSVSGKIKAAELSQFCNQFAVMISSGISIVEAVHLMSEQAFSHTLRSTLAKIEKDLRQGVILSDAMAKFPRLFPPFFSSMVYIGEAAGCLDRVLVSVADYYTREEQTKKKIAGALAYPAILLVMLVGVMILMMAFVIPRFMDSFSKMDIEMPALTVAVFNLSLFFQENGLFVLAFVAAFIIIIMFALKFLPSVQEFYDRLKFTLPVFSKINLAIFSARFCRSLGLLLASGSDSLSALENIKKTISNRYMLRHFNRVLNNVRMGMSLSAAITASMKLSPVLIQIITVGERTGELDSVLLKTAPYFDQQADNSLNLITTIIQPAVLLLLGVGIGVLFLAMYSPILAMVQNMRI